MQSKYILIFTFIFIGIFNFKHTDSTKLKPSYHIIIIFFFFQQYIDLHFFFYLLFNIFYLIEVFLNLKKEEFFIIKLTS
jgi:hypothetical protein